MKIRFMSPVLLALALVALVLVPMHATSPVLAQVVDTSVPFYDPGVVADNTTIYTEAILLNPGYKSVPTLQKVDVFLGAVLAYTNTLTMTVQYSGDGVNFVDSVLDTHVITFTNPLTTTTLTDAAYIAAIEPVGAALRFKIEHTDDITPTLHVTRYW